MKDSLFAVLIALLPLPACATTYSAEPITAWVIDAETKQPLEGVNVVAHWQLEGGLEGGNNIGQMMVMETVTDSTGKFTFPAWGPKEMPSGLPWYHWNARLKNLDPEMLFFKSGYEYLRLFNEKSMEQMKDKAPYVRTSDWNGKTIKMKRFRGGLKAYSDSLSDLMSALNDSTARGYCTESGCVARGTCDWRNIPAMIVAIGKQERIFRAAGISDSTFHSRLVTSEDYFLRSGCGSVKEFLREYGK